MSKNENWDDHTVIPTHNQDSARDMLSDYLKSNEYNLIVSLLAGHHHPLPLSAPTTIYQNRATEADTMDAHRTNMDSAFQSGPLVAATTDATSNGQHEHVCKPRYASNAAITLQDLDMLPPLQQNLLH